MIKALTPLDAEFLCYKTQLKEMYELNQDKICDTNSFEFITSSTLFYFFTDTNGTLLGAIYFFLDEENKLFLNAFSGRGHHKENLECLRLSMTWFNCDIYAEAQNRASVLCLLRCGFERKKDNIFVYRK